MTQEIHGPEDLSDSEVFFEGDESADQALEQPDPIKAIKSLQRQGFNLNYRNGYNGHVLINAARTQPEVVSYLLSQGADPNVKSSWGTSLSVAASSSSVPPSTVAELLEHGAKTAADPALHEAAYAANVGSAEKIKILLQHGADPNALCEERGTTGSRMLDRSGPVSPYGTALHEAAGAHYVEEMHQNGTSKFDPEEQVQAIGTLLQAGANSQAKDSKGRLALDWVSEGPLYRAPAWKILVNSESKAFDKEQHLQRLTKLLTRS